MNSANRSERGGGSFSVILGLVVIAAVVLLAIRLLPPYIANYQFQDYIDNTARTATYSAITEADLKKEIMGRGRELGIPLEDRQVAVQKVRGGSVNIAITYEVPVDLIARQVVLRFAPSAGNQNITAR
jgi:hypothetical protein